MKGKFGLDQKLARLSPEQLLISEITLAELKFGVENSEQPARNRQALAHFLSGVQVVPIIEALDIFAKEKARLRKAGTIIDDFDLLIGTTAVAHGLTLLSNNGRHLARVEGIELEDWTL